MGKGLLSRSQEKIYTAGYRLLRGKLLKCYLDIYFETVIAASDVRRRKHISSPNLIPDSRSRLGVMGIMPEEARQRALYKIFNKDPLISV